MKKKNIIFILAIVTFIILITILIINNINTPKEGNLLELTYSQIEEKVNHKDSFILIVSQSTCSHCASYKPKIETITKEYGIDVYYIDYDKEEENTRKEFLKEFNLTGATPITLFINAGKETSLLNRIEGETSKEKAITNFKKMGFIK